MIVCRRTQSSFPLFPRMCAGMVEELFLSDSFHVSLRKKSHKNKTGCNFAEQFLENTETKITVANDWPR